MLPTVNFCGINASRLIVGGNPFGGHTYIPDVYSKEEMLNYYTADHVVSALFDAEKASYTAFIPLGDEFMQRVIRQYRNEGGTMQFIAQTHPPMDFAVNVGQLVKAGAGAIFHQGTMTDNFVEEGNIKQIRENLKIIQDTGLPVGLATHVPETILRSEEENWGVDFYMACVHNMRKREKYQSSFITGKQAVHQFFQEDRAEMFRIIRQVAKPCIAFKILSGGNLACTREGLTDAFRETYKNIKPTDLAVVGVYQKHKNQLTENAEIVSGILEAL